MRRYHDRKRSRRAFLRDAARFGGGAVAAAALGQRASFTGVAREARASGGVRMADIRESTAADFARGTRDAVDLVTEAGNTELRSSGGVFTSGVVELPFAATHLGLHWTLRSVSPLAAGVLARHSADGVHWNEWHPLSIEAIADHSANGSRVESSIPIHGHGHDLEQGPGTAANREVFATLISGGRSGFMQYQVAFATDDVSLGAMTITAIDAGESVAVASAPRTSQTFDCADGSSLTVITREGWGCDEQLRFHRRGTEIWPEMYVPGKKVVLHHTATSNDYTNGAAEVRAIYAYHAKTLGWGDIGYNTLIDRFGQVYEGRHGRGEDAATREIVSRDVVAGHVFAHNYGSTGIAVIGNFDQIAPDSSLLGRVADVMTFECGRNFIVPGGSSDFLRSDAVWYDAMANITGHDDSTATACPGANLKPHLPALREVVAQRLSGAPMPDLVEMTGTGREREEPTSLSFSWSPTGPQYVLSLEAWDKASNSENISYLSGYEPAGYGDALAMRQVWSAPSSSTTAGWNDIPAGRYTMHVREADGTYAARMTFLVKPKATGPGKGKPKK